MCLHKRDVRAWESSGMRGRVTGRGVAVHAPCQQDRGPRPRCRGSHPRRGLGVGGTEAGRRGAGGGRGAARPRQRPPRQGPPLLLLPPCPLPLPAPLFPPSQSLERRVWVRACALARVAEGRVKEAAGRRAGQARGRNPPSRRPQARSRPPAPAAPLRVCSAMWEADGKRARAGVVRAAEHGQPRRQGARPSHPARAPPRLRR
eukprot:1449749-Rhodomonas_salina.1